MINQGLQTRFLPVTWRFIAETPMPCRSTQASPVPTPRVLSVQPSTPGHRRTASSPCPPALSSKPAKFDGCAAAEAAHRRRLSNARNIYERLHWKQPDPQFHANLRVLSQLEVTTVFRKHLEKRKLRVPLAIRGTTERKIIVT